MEVIRFLDRDVEVIRRPRRRGVVLTMHPDKNLCVKTNQKTSQQQILQFLTTKSRWIEKNLARFASLDEQFVMPTASEGSLFPFLGEMKYLNFTVSPATKRMHFKIEDGFLVCYGPLGVPLSSPVFFMQLKKFYKSEAISYLEQRLRHWSEATGLAPLTLGFRANQTRWGSCNSRNHISLNWKLICQAPQLIDYVIIHELCHLKYLNHSEKFWSLLESFMPEYACIEKVLHQQERLGRFLN